MACDLQVGVIGVAIELTFKDCDGVVIDISSATTKQIILEAPGDASVAKTAVFTTDGTDGKIRYVTLSGDIDEAGCWKAQGKVITPTSTLLSKITEFEVLENL